jgi:hypothetical protein
MSGPIKRPFTPKGHGAFGTAGWTRDGWRSRHQSHIRLNANQAGDTFPLDGMAIHRENPDGRAAASWSVSSRLVLAPLRNQP